MASMIEEPKDVLDAGKEMLHKYHFGSVAWMGMMMI